MLIINNGMGERVELLAGIEVMSSGGVPPLWASLLEHLPHTGKILDYGSWQGLAALWLHARGQEPSFAHYSAEKIAQARDNGAKSGFDLRCQGMFPIRGNWDTILLAAPEQNEALTMLAGQGAAALSSSGKLLVVDKFVRRRELASWFEDVVEIERGGDGAILLCTQPRGLTTELPWNTVHIQIKGLNFELDSLPGTFSPTGLDSGTRAMLTELDIPPGGRVLDLGCGYGVVGITLTHLGAREVAYVDEDLIALTACRRNLDSLELKGELVHSHWPWDLPGKFDLVLTNPPYHADYGVPRSFLEFAGRRLNDDGWIMIVIKKPQWYIKKMRTVFGGCKIMERDGYYILAAQKRGTGRGKGRGSKKTTRKHRRKVQSAKKRR